MPRVLNDSAPKRGLANDCPAVRPGPEPEALGSEPIDKGQPLVGCQFECVVELRARRYTSES
jgi:hypothetical protein